MNTAAKKYMGDHDFRNFSKMDASCVSNFHRLIFSSKVYRMATWQWDCNRQSSESKIEDDLVESSLPFPDSDSPSDVLSKSAELTSRSRSTSAAEKFTQSICCFEITGQAFLWHMVRCLVKILILIGKGLEDI